MPALLIVPRGRMFHVLGPGGTIAKKCKTRAAAEDFVRTWEMLLGAAEKLRASRKP